MLTNHGVYQLTGDFRGSGLTYEYIEYMDGPAGDELGRLHQLNLRLPEPQILRGGQRWDIHEDGRICWRGAWYGATLDDLKEVHVE